MTGALFGAPFYFGRVLYFARMLPKKPAYPFIIACLLSLFITVLLCSPGTQFPTIKWKDRIFLDKWIHAALFAVLVVVWCWVYFKKVNIANKQRYFKIALLVFIYGIATELIQEFLVPFRSFEIPDIIADGVGAAAGYFISAKKLIKK